MFVSPQGVITFGQPDTSYTNGDLSGSSVPPAIAPMWADWFNQAGETVSYEIDTTSQQLIVQWDAAEPNDVYATGTATFQAILQLNTGATDGNIIYNYLQTDTGSIYSDNGQMATVGIKDGGPQGPDRLLIAQNDGANADIASGEAILVSHDGLVTGQVYLDQNQDGVQVPGDPGLAGRTVYAEQNGSQVAATVTDANGNYMLDLPPGTYTIDQVLPADWTQAAAATSSYTVTLQGGDAVTGENFGDYELAAACRSSARKRSTFGKRARKARWWARSRPAIRPGCRSATRSRPATRTGPLRSTRPAARSPWPTRPTSFTPRSRHTRSPFRSPTRAIFPPPRRSRCS